MYYILMGDIVDSRKKNVEFLWDKFNLVINSANERYESKILSHLEIKIGDEFQVVLKDINSLLSLINYLDVFLSYYEIKCRFAIGYGEVYGNINIKHANNMMGLGLTSTNELLSNKSLNLKYRFFIQDDMSKSFLLNAIGTLLSSFTEKRTHKQIEYLYYKLIENKSLDEIANLMNVTKRNIYHYEKTSKNELINEIFEMISLSFNSDIMYVEKKYEELFGIKVGKIS